MNGVYGPHALRYVRNLGTLVDRVERAVLLQEINGDVRSALGEMGQIYLALAAEMEPVINARARGIIFTEMGL